MKERIVWIDLETTGLDPEEDHIVEVACVITEGVRPVATFHRVVKRSPFEWQLTNDFVRKMHTDSGLYQESIDAEFGRFDVERQLKEFILANTNTKSLLGGSSVHFDRAFLKTQMWDVEALLSHRNIDTSTITQALRYHFDLHSTRKAPHRAMPDIMGSIHVWRQYMSLLVEGINVFGMSQGRDVNELPLWGSAAEEPAQLPLPLVEGEVQ